jgi:hypothetical protein
MYDFAPAIRDPANVEELHNMRIAAKRLRYTMELFAPVFDKEFAQTLKVVEDIQERLGAIHDADVIVPLLEDAQEKETERERKKALKKNSGGPPLFVAAEGLAPLTARRRRTATGYTTSLSPFGTRCRPTPFSSASGTRFSPPPLLRTRRRRPWRQRTRRRPEQHRSRRRPPSKTTRTPRLSRRPARRSKITRRNPRRPRPPEPTQKRRSRNRERLLLRQPEPALGDQHSRPGDSNGSWSDGNLDHAAAPARKPLPCEEPGQAVRAPRHCVQLAVCPKVRAQRTGRAARDRVLVQPCHGREAAAPGRQVASFLVSLDGETYTPNVSCSRDRHRIAARSPGAPSTAARVATGTNSQGVPVETR